MKRNSLTQTRRELSDRGKMALDRKNKNKNKNKIRSRERDHKTDFSSLHQRDFCTHCGSYFHDKLTCKSAREDKHIRDRKREKGIYGFYGKSFIPERKGDGIAVWKIQIPLCRTWVDAVKSSRPTKRTFREYGNDEGVCSCGKLYQDGIFFATTSERGYWACSDPDCIKAAEVAHRNDSKIVMFRAAAKKFEGRTVIDILGDCNICYPTTRGDAYFPMNSEQKHFEEWDGKFYLKFKIKEYRWNRKADYGYTDKYDHWVPFDIVGKKLLTEMTMLSVAIIFDQRQICDKNFVPPEIWSSFINYL